MVLLLKMEITWQTSDLSELSGTIHSERVVFGSSDATLFAVAVVCVCVCFLGGGPNMIWDSGE